MNIVSAREALETLLRIGGPRLLDDVVASFRVQAPARAAEARAGWRAGNADSLARAAHALKSSSAQLGAAELAEACAAAEAAGAAGEIGQAGETLARVEAELDDFLRELPELAARTGAHAPTRLVGVVEDSEDTRMILRRILEPDYRVVECATGTEALIAFARREPDAILLDISLPGMDGVEVLARLRADPALQRIPVVALTAHAMVGDREAFLAQGFDDYASKPIVDESVILSILRRLLGPRR